MVTKIKTNKIFFPLKRNFAKAYPANELKNNTEMVTAVETKNELYNAPNKLIVSSTFLKLVTRWSPGNIAGGTLFTTWFGLVAMTNIQ